MSTSAANTIPDTQLGLSSDEVQLLRYHQIQATNANGSNSSRAASRASSAGLLLLDTSSLTTLTHHFDRLLSQIQARLDWLTTQTETVTMQQYDRAGNAIEMADAEIARFHGILREIDEMETDFDRIRHIRDIVRGYRQRVEQLEREMEQSDSRGSRRHGDGHRHRSHHTSSGGGGSSSRRHRR